MKRWLLTHKHTDLQDEFRARLDRQGTLPTEHQRAIEQSRAHLTRIQDLSELLAAARGLSKRHARIVQVLTLENEHLRQQIANQQPTWPLRPHPLITGPTRTRGCPPGRRLSFLY